MFLANNKRLCAETEQGVASAQLEIVNLFTSNLSSLATQSCLIAALAYVGTSNAYTIIPNKHGFLAFFYQSLYVASLTSSLTIVCQCTIATMLGPTKAMLGETFIFL